MLATTSAHLLTSRYTRVTTYLALYKYNPHITIDLIRGEKKKNEKKHNYLEYIVGQQNPDNTSLIHHALL
jgi:hypothetical protein